MFEYDENKSESNLIKHGIDFVTAQKIWDDPDRLEIPARTQDEPRFLVLGKGLAGKSSFQRRMCFCVAKRITDNIEDDALPSGTTHPTADGNVLG